MKCYFYSSLKNNIRVSEIHETIKKKSGHNPPPLDSPWYLGGVEYFQIIHVMIVGHLNLFSPSSLVTGL